MKDMRVKAFVSFFNSDMLGCPIYLGLAFVKMTINLYTHILDDYKMKKMLKLESLWMLF